MSTERELLEQALEICLNVGSLDLAREIKATLAQPNTGGMTAIDLSDDDALRFVQRVLESDAPESDRLAARDMIVWIRTRFRDMAKYERKPDIKPLSELEIRELAEQTGVGIVCSGEGDFSDNLDAIVPFARTIEAAVWEKMGCK